MRSYRYLFSLIIFLGLAGSVFSQDLKSDLLKINKAYQTIESYSMEITYNLYSNRITGKIDETEKSTVFKKGHNLNTRLGPVETISNEKYAVTIYNEDKIILINHSNKKNNSFLPLNFDSIGNLVSDIKVLSSEQGVKAYRLKLIGGEFDEIEVYFNEKTYLVSKLVLFPNINPANQESEARVEIVISRFNPDPALSDNLFKESRFVQIKGKVVSAQPSYSNYKVISYLGSK